MNQLFIAAFLCIAVGANLAAPGYGPGAVLVGLVFTLPTLFVLNSIKDDTEFLRNIFLWALLARIVLAIILFATNKSFVLGPDGQTYDEFARDIIKYWDDVMVYKYNFGINPNNLGMSYVVVAIYWVIGRNPLAIQLMNATVGAATVPIIYLCTYTIFHNIRAARFSAYLIAFFPSLILWSSLGLKDALIVFLLATTMLCTLRLLDQLRLSYLLLLLLSLFGLYGLRFYIFYMMLIAIVGGFLIGSRSITGFVIVRQIVLLIIVIGSVAYLGAVRNTSTEFETFVDLKRAQNVRQWGATVSESGFGEDADVSTVEGAISFAPIGALYVLFAPFPWQMTRLSNLMTLPEMLIWWGTLPLLVSGLIYSIRHKFRTITPVLLFTFLLTVAYSIYQSNVGTAYRQRSQLLIFYLMFTAVGIVLRQEKKENQKQTPEKVNDHYQIERRPFESIPSK